MVVRDGAQRGEEVVKREREEGYCVVISKHAAVVNVFQKGR